jgi:hypothetical protein
MRENRFTGRTPEEIRDIAHNEFGDRPFEREDLDVTPPFIQLSTANYLLAEYNVGCSQTPYVGNDFPGKRAFFIAQKYMTGIPHRGDKLGNTLKKPIEQYAGCSSSDYLHMIEGTALTFYAMQVQMGDSFESFINRFRKLHAYDIDAALLHTFAVEGKPVKSSEKCDIMKPDAQLFMLPPHQIHLVDVAEEVGRAIGVVDTFRDGATAGYNLVENLWSRLYPQTPFSDPPYTQIPMSGFDLKKE